MIRCATSAPPVGQADHVVAPDPVAPLAEAQPALAFEDEEPLRLLAVRMERVLHLARRKLGQVVAELAGVDAGAEPRAPRSAVPVLVDVVERDDVEARERLGHGTSRRRVDGGRRESAPARERRSRTADSGRQVATRTRAKRRVDATSSAKAPGFRTLSGERALERGLVAQRDRLPDRLVGAPWTEIRPGQSVVRSMRTAGTRCDSSFAPAQLRGACVRFARGCACPLPAASTRASRPRGHRSRRPGGVVHRRVVLTTRRAAAIVSSS